VRPVDNPHRKVFSPMLGKLKQLTELHGELKAARRLAMDREWPQRCVLLGDCMPIGFWSLLKCSFAWKG
jgi:hypothetical protein